MHFLNLECIFPSPDSIVVKLIPRSGSGEFGAREAGKGM